MLKVTSSVVINKPVAEVFAFMINAENDTKWQGGVDQVIPEGPQDVVGAKYTEVRKFMGQASSAPPPVSNLVPSSSEREDPSSLPIPQ